MTEFRLALCCKQGSEPGYDYLVYYPVFLALFLKKPHAAVQHIDRHAPRAITLSELQFKSWGIPQRFDRIRAETVPNRTVKSLGGEGLACIQFERKNSAR